MTLPIALVMGILVLAVALFVTERLRVDLVALLVLGSLALTELVTPAEAISGFSSPAVITVWAVFILSGGMARTGVAGLIGRQVLRLAGTGEVRLMAVIMLTAGVMSAFMNNVGVAALLLPVVMDIARRTDYLPSRLLMPLAYGSLLGGLMTLIGTPPNILVSDALGEYGLRPFQLFDYAPVGVVVMLGGVAFMALVGRHLLPARHIAKEFAGQGQTDLDQVYGLRERLVVLHLPADSALVGKTLGESRLGSALGINVIGIIRDGQTQLSPETGTVLDAGDRLLVAGRLDRLAELRGRPHLILEEDKMAVESLDSTQVEVAELSLTPRSPFLGQTLRQVDFRHRFGVNVLAIRRSGSVLRIDLQDIPLQLDDTLLIQGPPAQLDVLQDSPDMLVSAVEAADVYRLHERLLIVRVPPDSTLVGRTLAESRLGDAFGFTVLGIVREGTARLVPEATERLKADDTLLVEGKPEDLLTLTGLQDLEIDRQSPPDLGALESERVGLMEVVLSPKTTLAGQSLRRIHFREKYGLNVLAIWRQGRPYRTDLRDMAVRFGDALLLYGPRDKLRMLGHEPDFLVLTEEAQEPPRLRRAPVAALVMGAVLLPVILGWLPISISAVVGASLMVLTGCLTMDEAYRSIEWKAVFLIAGMLPLGIAMQQTGAARFLADGVVATVGGRGPRAVMAGLFVLTTLATQVMPNPAVAVLLAPIALSTANDLGLSPYALMMTIALAASASFLSPVSHPANVLIMGPGGYRFTDYIKVGLPLTLVVLVITLLVLPVFWPFYL
jgi:di/tricarboxylate transporter